MSERQQNFTAEDWKALYFVHRLTEEVARHGKPALDTFLEAAREFGEPQRNRSETDGV